MMPASSHGPAPAEPIIVEIEGVGELEFPGDTDPSVIQAKVKELTAPPMHPHAKVGQWVKDNAPMVGGLLGAAVTGGASIPLSMIGGASGAVIGSRVRGDSPDDARKEGLKQMAIEGGGNAGMRLIGGIAKRVYRGAIPKAIQDKFSKADLAGQGVESRVMLGTKGGTRQAETASRAAANQTQRAATGAPSLTAQDIQKAFGPKYNRALIAGKTDKAKEIGAHVKQSTDEINAVTGQTGGQMSGPQQLARKEFLEQEGKSAMQAANSNMAAVNPQLANIERKAIVANLRRSPEMATALNKSQAAIGVERAAKATENSSLVNRLSHGGLWNAARSPAAFSGAGIAINEGRQLLNPQVLRLLDLLMSQGSHE